jgi:hypothetical protein
VTFWAEVFLGIIALATFTMAAIQVGVLVVGLMVAKRVNRMLDQVERQMQPAADSLNAIARDAARVSALAAGQAERVDQLITDLTVRVEQTAATVQDAVLKPLREGAAMLAGIKAAIEIFRGLARRPDGSRRSDEEDALFIG